MVMEPLAKRPRPTQRFCPHCCEILAYKTYRAHKRLYFDSNIQEWTSHNERHGDHREASPVEGDSSPASTPYESEVDEFDPDILTSESPPLSDAAESSDSTSIDPDNGM